MQDILLLTPPFTQLNTPYPATAYLKGFLNTKNISSYQTDLGIEVILELFSKNGLINIFKNANCTTDANILRINSLQSNYIATIDAVISFLQGKNQTLARQICSRNFLPEAARFQQLDDLEYAFGTMGLQDKAKHLATLYLEDLSDFIVACIDNNFGFSRYAEKLGRSANSFDEMHTELQRELTYIDEITLKILNEKVKKIQPKLILISVPFPGNLYSAFRCAQFVKQQFPDIKLSMGGGFPNTELRSLTDVRVFNFFNFITLDDGELPVELLYDSIVNPGENRQFKRTFVLENNQVVYKNNTLKSDYKQFEVGTPDYADLKLDKYISVIEIANPMHSLWSDGRWNKLTMAHGCYWGKCTFCDISLDYIKLYEPVAANILVDRMEELIAKTHENGFHFVDEAAPPALMRAVALEIIKRKLVVSWWTNIRFEKSFSSDLCFLLAESGCIAVSGGLEVASDRLLKLIDKGVTVEQVAKVTRNFTEAGVMVHAYLMYGYPTQTIQETIDSLEMVRQMFKAGILQSGFWHQFAMTAHSPVGINPEAFGVIPDLKPISFANNDVNFKDKTGINHELFGYGLKKSLFNYMHNMCFDFDLQEWFDFKIPKTKINSEFIYNALHEQNSLHTKATAKIIWLGNNPISEIVSKTKKGQTWQNMVLIFNNKKQNNTLQTSIEEGKWLVSMLEKISIHNNKTYTFEEVKADFELELENFELFWYSKPMLTFKKSGLLVL